MLVTIGTNKKFGKFCGNKTGEIVWVTGNYTMITFHSDHVHRTERRGFLIRFVAVVKTGKWELHK